MSTASDVLYLKKREERRVRHGHPWVFSNEIDTARSPIKQLIPGQPVEVRAYNDRVVGSGYANPSSLICVRLISAGAGSQLDRALLSHRLRCALEMREAIFTQPHYRLVHAEGDDLPGLVVDRFGDVLVAQIGTAGMERVRGILIDALVELLAPRAIVLRNDIASRALEGLEQEVEVAYGALPARVEIEENSSRFLVSPLDGQKTGWFYDQRLNRQRLAHYARGARVLDVFSYSGGFGIGAAVAGAAAVICVDASARSLELLRENARLNRVEHKVRSEAGDAFQVLRALAASGERFDIVVIDPPAFVARKKDMDKGVEAYRRINRLGCSLLAGRGILLTASCSSHLDRDRFRELLHRAAVAEGKHLRILEQGHQGPDHPIHPALPESEYLKVFLSRITDS